jgi:hypothetical protein
LRVEPLSLCLRLARNRRTDDENLKQGVFIMTGRAFEDLYSTVAMTAGEELGLDVSPADVGWIVAEVIEGFINTPPGPVLPAEVVTILLKIADDARKTRNEL